MQNNSKVKRGRRKIPEHLKKKAMNVVLDPIDHLVLEYETENGLTETKNQKAADIIHLYCMIKAQEYGIGLTASK